MTILVDEAAKKICDLGKWQVTNLALQKILYLAFMVYLGKTQKRLFDGRFEAWTYGPVLPSLYDYLKIFGADPIRDRFYHTAIIAGTEEAVFLEEIGGYLLSKESYKLVAMTHRKNGAWAKNYRPEGYVPIPEEDILEEYRLVYG